jgi:hypothetical protein
MLRASDLGMHDLVVKGVEGYRARHMCAAGLFSAEERIDYAVAARLER